jgi:hypothetical protein
LPLEPKGEQFVRFKIRDPLDQHLKRAAKLLKCDVERFLSSPDHVARWFLDAPVIREIIIPACILKTRLFVHLHPTSLPIMPPKVLICSE